MNWRHPGLALAVAAVGLVIIASAASGGVAAQKQRIAIEAKLNLATSKGSFTLIPLSPGRLKRDSGTLIGIGVLKPPIIRNGQRIVYVVGKDVHTGKNGSFVVIQPRVETVTAGRGASAARGPITFQGKTGAYKGVTGAGAFGSASPAKSPILYYREEGILTIP